MRNSSWHPTLLIRASIALHLLALGCANGDRSSDDAAMDASSEGWAVALCSIRPNLRVCTVIELCTRELNIEPVEHNLGVQQFAHEDRLA